MPKLVFDFPSFKEPVEMDLFEAHASLDKSKEEFIVKIKTKAKEQENASKSSEETDSNGDGPS
tara:strand:+ start:393 stop:581 length:189 start_codon:yes stop_codon:yes gene_type:complete